MPQPSSLECILNTVHMHVPRSQTHFIHTCTRLCAYTACVQFRILLPSTHSLTVPCHPYELPPGSWTWDAAAAYWRRALR